MRHVYLLLMAVVFGGAATAQCTPGQIKIKLVLLTDNYPQETTWNLKNGAGTVLMHNVTGMQGATVYKDSICVPAGTCYTFTMNDAANDGICCNFGFGHYYLYVNDTLKKADSSFTSMSSYSTGCPPGASCSTASVVAQGTFTAPGPGSWYSFTPAAAGIYTVSTCNLGNTCNTKLWLYDYCTNLVYDTTNLATIYYADDNCGGQNETVNAYMSAGHTYYIRVGGAGTGCTGVPITWKINQATSISGCLDTAACNFNPFATIATPGSCLYYPSPLCPTGPDLKVDSVTLRNSINISTTNSSDVCTIREGCMNGYNARELVNFSTRIDNVGATDFYAGTPPANVNTYSPIYGWDACHGHWHFKDYAEYLLADANNNFIPIGYKNGFCVLDLTCSTGTPKFGCNNMGITSGCADIYSSGLPCQWVDVTDIPDGNYKLIVRVNWNPRPDFYGRYETSYFNNWARSCITIGHNGAIRTVTVAPNCAPYIDCAGVENGLAVRDCAGTCNGTKMQGDLDNDGQRNILDVSAYMDASVYHNLPATKCNDLNDDGKLNVIDAALLFDCSVHGVNSNPLGHSHRPCKFPDKIKNPNQHAYLSVGNIDYFLKTFEVYVTNPDARLLGYQFKISGAKLSGAQDFSTGFNASTKYRPGGQVITLTNDETFVPKNQTKVLLMKLRFDSISATTICIDSVVAVNEAYEEIVTGVQDSSCIHSIITPNAVANVAAATVPHYLYPNPLTHTSTLELNSNPSQTFSATITDLPGRTVRVYASRSGNILRIDRGDLRPGMYYLNVQSSTWKFSEKLMVQ